MFRNAKRFTSILLVLILAASTYAFAAANTVAFSNAGVGVGEVGGYAVSDVAYVFDLATTPLAPTVSKILFTLKPAAPNTIAALPASVHISYLVAGSAKYTTAAVCGGAGIVVVGAGTEWRITCDLSLDTPATLPAITAVVALHVVASSAVGTALDPTPQANKS